MSRLIDVDALIKDFDKRCFGECCCCIESTNTESGCKVIDGQSTVDAVPVVHGHWIGWSGEKMVDYYNETYKKIHGYRCSNCNRNTAVKSKYCSCCGALMDEVTNNVQTN